MNNLNPPMPKVTIGMPVYNGELFIRKALDSLLEQTFTDFELIISDNASTDKTEVICRDYAANDLRIRYVIQPENLGAMANFKFVLDEAVGEYFMWAAHDDWWDSHFVEAAVKALDKNPTAAASMGVVHYIKSNGDKFMTHKPPYGLDSGNAGMRAYAYFRQGVTDNLIYAVYRTGVLRSAPFELSTCPEKLIILHALLSGAIVDAEQMEYFNVVSFKTQEEVATVLCLDQYGYAEETKVFQGISRLLYERMSLLAFSKLFLVFFFKNNWHKFFSKRFLHAIGLV